MPLHDVTVEQVARAERQLQVHPRALAQLAQSGINERWNLYEQMSGVERSLPTLEEEEAASAGNGDGQEEK